jgi:hypothetical protein
MMWLVAAPFKIASVLSSGVATLAPFGGQKTTVHLTDRKESFGSMPRPKRASRAHPKHRDFDSGTSLPMAE